MGRGDSSGAGVRAQFHYENRYGSENNRLVRRGSTQHMLNLTPDVLEKQQENYNKTCEKR